jgi:hypothetical protein
MKLLCKTTEYSLSLTREELESVCGCLGYTVNHCKTYVGSIPLLLHKEMEAVLDENPD